MKAQGFLARKKLEPTERVDAGKAKMGKADALTLARSASKIVVAKGKSVIVFDVEKDAPTDAELLAAILGPTGNLRAPTLRRGSTLIVGFSAEAYDEAFG